MPEKVKRGIRQFQHILPNIQDKNNREVDKGIDSQVDSFLINASFCSSDKLYFSIAFKGSDLNCCRKKVLLFKSCTNRNIS